VIRDDLRVTLLDADRRKAAFLEATVSDLGLSAVHVAMLAAEDAARTAMREAFDLAVARALAPLDVSWELTLPLVSVGGRAVLLKGPSVRAELARGQAAATALGGGDQTWSEWALRGGERRIIVTVMKLAPTPTRFPRRPGIPRRRPLKG
jgi:16S rRNA (guanine527-N7)-methyltransferase